MMVVWMLTIASKIVACSSRPLAYLFQSSNEVPTTVAPLVHLIITLSNHQRRGVFNHHQLIWHILNSRHRIK